MPNLIQGPANPFDAVELERPKPAVTYYAMCALPVVIGLGLLSIFLLYLRAIRYWGFGARSIKPVQWLDDQKIGVMARDLQSRLVFAVTHAALSIALVVSVAVAFYLVYRWAVENRPWGIPAWILLVGVLVAGLGLVGVVYAILRWVIRVSPRSRLARRWRSSCLSSTSRSPR